MLYTYFVKYRSKFGSVNASGCTVTVWAISSSKSTTTESRPLHASLPTNTSRREELYLWTASNSLRACKRWVNTTTTGRSGPARVICMPGRMYVTALGKTSQWINYNMCMAMINKHIPQSFPNDSYTPLLLPFAMCVSTWYCISVTRVCVHCLQLCYNIANWALWVGIHAYALLWL